MIGVVQSGHGAAQRDVANGVYAELGDLYPGSLNLRIERGALTEWGEPDKVIAGPECPLWLWRGEVANYDTRFTERHAWDEDAVSVDVWVMHPCRWPPIEYAEIVELFATERLRDLLGLDDGDELEVAQ